jgi:cation:H+ antiporter
MLLASLVFVVSAGVVIAAGTALTRYADAIAERTGIGRVWVGSVLLAAATSLPELATDVSAVRLHAPNLAVGDLFGSSLANMFILAVIDLLPPRGRVFRQATFENTLAACLAIVMNALGALFVLVRPRFSLLGVTPESVLLLLIYVAGTRAVYRNGLRHMKESAPAKPSPQSGEAARGLRRPILEFAAAAAVIFVAAPSLAWSAKSFAEFTHLGTTFVGTWLLGLSTSMPELVTSLAAVRIGAFDLAVGNLFGSNSFNMVIFFALDIASPAGSIFSALDPVHAVSGALGVILMTLGLAGIVYRAERRFMMIEPDSALMLVAYLLAIWLVYTHAGGR